MGVCSAVDHTFIESLLSSVCVFGGGFWGGLEGGVGFTQSSPAKAGKLRHCCHSPQRTSTAGHTFRARRHLHTTCAAVAILKDKAGEGGGEGCHQRGRTAANLSSQGPAPTTPHGHTIFWHLMETGSSTRKPSQEGSWQAQTRLFI